LLYFLEKAGSKSNKNVSLNERNTQSKLFISIVSKMKKILLAIVFISFVAAVMSSCSGSRRGMGCPSHNSRYFRS
jgi:hypothetical protein